MQIYTKLCKSTHCWTGGVNFTLPPTHKRQVASHGDSVISFILSKKELINPNKQFLNETIYLAIVKEVNSNLPENKE